MLSRVLVGALFLPLAFLLVFRSAGVLVEVEASTGATQAAAGTPPAEQARMDAQNTALRGLLQPVIQLPMAPGALAVTAPPTMGWALGMVSWVAAAPDGLIYLLQRGEKADPIIAIDREGTIVRSWGKGLYSTPHAIRVDPQGNVWTADAASSKVYKFKPDGTLLLTIEVGGQPTPCGNFCGTTDMAFAGDGHVFIADGYRNARILEYTAEGKKVTEWGRAGTGPGEFRLPHSIQIDERGIVYVAYDARHEVHQSGLCQCRPRGRLSACGFNWRSVWRRPGRMEGAADARWAARLAGRVGQ